MTVVPAALAAGGHLRAVGAWRPEHAGWDILRSDIQEAGDISESIFGIRISKR